MIHSILHNRNARLYMMLGSVFIVSALVAEVVGVKLFTLDGNWNWQQMQMDFFGGSYSLHLSAGMLAWPVVYIITDIVNEYYGPKGVRFLTVTAIVLIVYSFLIFRWAMGLSPSENFNLGFGVADPDAAFRGVFGQGVWVIFGSLSAFWVSQSVDVSIFRHIKKRTGNKKLWLRATGSTLVSQLIDSFLFFFIAYYLGTRIQLGNPDRWTFSQVLMAGLGSYIFNSFIVILITPLVYIVRWMADQYLGRHESTVMKETAMRHKNG